MKYSILKNHIQIKGWMVEECRLRGNKLIIFAIIWGFTGNKKAAKLFDEWPVNYRYIEAWTGLGENMVDTIIQELQADGLINLSEDYAVCVDENYKE